MNETIEQCDERKGILFIYRVDVGSEEREWRWSVDMLIGGRKCNACSPTEYSTQAAIRLPALRDVPEPSEAERITDGLIRAQQWAMDYLAERDWVKERPQDQTGTS